MTRDFRQPGPSDMVSPEELGAMPQAQRIVVRVLTASAVMLFGFGLWLLLGEQTLFDADVAPIIGFAFMFGAATDLVAIRVIRRLWARGRPGIGS